MHANGLTIGEAKAKLKDTREKGSGRRQKASKIFQTRTTSSSGRKLATEYEMLGEV